MDLREMSRLGLRRGPIVGLVLATGLVLASCGAAVEEASEQALEAATGSDDIEIDDDGIRVTDDEGNELAFGSQAQLPEEWPDDVPVPEGDVVTSFTTPGGVSASFSADGDPNAVYNDLKGQLESQGWAQESTAQAGGFKSGTFTKGERVVNVSVADDPQDGLVVNVAASEPNAQ